MSVFVCWIRAVMSVFVCWMSRQPHMQSRTVHEDKTLVFVGYIKRNFTFLVLYHILSAWLWLNVQGAFCLWIV